jgi:hypothetical protein
MNRHLTCASCVRFASCRGAAGVRAVPGRRSGDAGGWAVWLHRGGRRHGGVPASGDAGGARRRARAPARARRRTERVPRAQHGGRVCQDARHGGPGPGVRRARAGGFTSKDGVPNVRARVLGGGTAINAGFYSRAHPESVTDLGFRRRTLEKLHL